LLLGGLLPFDFDPDALDPYEFTWGSAGFDVQNDGLLDLYFVGSLIGRGGGLTPLFTGPGRLLVNTTMDEEGLTFKGQTAEHHLFNILELKYDRLESEGYIYRRAPSKNWRARDRVYSYDRSTWIQRGVLQEKRTANHDLIQAAENGRAAIAADLNNDGFSDLILRNVGGYDSRSSKAVNLKAKVNGKVGVLPPHNANFPTPTNYEPGATHVFINTYFSNNWIKVRLIDNTLWNRDAVGARVIVNGRFLRVMRAGEGSHVSNKFEALHFGLGSETARQIEIHWPDRERTVTKLEVDALERGTLIVSKIRGVLAWQPVD